jgi:hypothetical protein
VTALAILALFLAAPSAAAPGWEKLYERPEKAPPMLAVWADESGWFASGPGLMVTGTAGGVKTQPMGELSVVGFTGESRKELFALGWDELILRLQGDQWVEEHRAIGLPRGGKGHGRNADDLLQVVVTLPGKPQPRVVAVGPWLVLVRHPDGIWQRLSEPERHATLMLAHLGLAEAAPKGCALAAWTWVGKDRAIFTCHDDRSFVLDAGKSTPMGKLPRACKQGLDRARRRNAEVSTLCYGQLWQSEGTRWRQIPGPAKMRDYAITDRCVYAVSDRAVFRRCSP